jgi:PPOX class probable F420-dependent enzyme
MEWKEALPLLQANHTGVAISVTPKGRAHATVVSTALLDAKLGFASRGYTVKVKNIQRTGRAAVTVIKLDTRRYVTVEGPASIEPWQDTRAHIKRLKDLYVAMGRAPKGTDEEFAQQMRDEERNLVLVTPERLYGSLRSGA